MPDAVKDLLIIIRRWMQYGSPEHHAYMRSARWRWLVQDRKGKIKHRCEACGYPKYLQGHHVTYKHLGFDNTNDIRIVCRACHWKITQLHRNGWPIPKATTYVIRQGRRKQRWKRWRWKVKRAVRRIT